ncbi:uncharacterized protein LOC123704820 [Colias croceus]|uniref:uncharacterized protein LOC123704820 n=1 Tax=Colias crocea TaxID=72248 RepID=UPI001E27CF04|nr:uncharacterized protein LOC123704820 [Colias croceus]
MCSFVFCDLLTTPALYLHLYLLPTTTRLTFFWILDLALTTTHALYLDLPLFEMELPADDVAGPSGLAGPSGAADLIPRADNDQDGELLPDPNDGNRELYGDYVPRRLYVDEILQRMNHARLVRECGTKEQCIEFAEANQMIPMQKLCPRHRSPMRIELTENNVGYFRCHKAPCRNARGKITRARNTWFERAKITLPQVFHLMYCFTRRWSYETAIEEDPDMRGGLQCLSMATVSDWYNYCRETVAIYQLEKQETIGKIGGPGKIVQIDESKFGVRKFNKGRRVEGHWVLGLIEDGSEDLRLEVCPDNIRSAEVLVPLIKKHVLEGTTIHTDFWRAYDCLAEHGYIHKKVNHSDPDNPFVAPDGTHTQRIEAQWRVVKRWFKKDNYNHPSNFADVVIEYQWRRWVQKNKLDPFYELIKAINHVYKF